MIEIRDPVTGRLLGEFGSHPSTVRGIAVSPDGNTIATITVEDTLVRLWDLRTRELLAVLDGHGAPINEVEFSPDGTRLASGGTDTDVGLWYVRPEDAVDQLCTNLRNAHAKDLDGIC